MASLTDITFPSIYVCNVNQVIVFVFFYIILLEIAFIWGSQLIKIHIIFLVTVLIWFYETKSEKDFWAIMRRTC